MVIPAPVASGQERPGEHREPPRRHEDHRGADLGLRRPAAAGVPDLGRELGHLPRDQGRGDPAPLHLLDMEQAGGSHLTIQRRRQPPPPGPRSDLLVQAFQSLVLEQAARPAAAAATDTDDAGVPEEAHHGSFTAKAARQEI